MRRKILMGVFALALPIGTIAGFGSAASAAKPPPNPTTCHLAAVVNISPPLSKAGTKSVKGAIGTTTVHVTWSSCTNGAVGANTITIQTKAGKDPNVATDGNGVANKKTYYLGLCGSFASSATTKSLGKAVKNLPVSGGILKGAKAAAGSVSGETGFIISNGTVKGGTHPTASHAATIKAGLVNDANNTNLITGCKTGPVSHIDIDPSTSTGTL